MGQQLQTRKETDEQRRDIQTRQLSLRAQTVNEEERSVEAVLTTESAVEMYDWREGGRIEEVLLLDGLKPPQQVPLLNTHGRYDLNDVLGSVKAFAEYVVVGEIRGLTGRLTFVAGDPDADRAWNKVRQGHLTDVSVGYRVEEYTDISPNQRAVIAGREFSAGKLRKRVATKWTLREVSVVPIGADQLAKTRGDEESTSPITERETEMASETRQETDSGGQQTQTRAESTTVTKPVTLPEGWNPQQRSEADIRCEAIEAERKRVKEIREMASDDVPAELVQRAIDEGWDDGRCSREFLGAVRAARGNVMRETGQAPAQQSRSHETDCNVRSLAAGLLIASGFDPTKQRMYDSRNKRALGRLTEQDADRGHEFSRLSAFDIARECALLDTGRHIRDPEEAMRAAFSGTSLDRVFTTNVYAELISGWEEEPDTSGWCQVEDVPNFLSQEDITLRAQAALDKLPRGKTASHATAEDDYETYKIARYAKQFAADEQDFIDDRLNALMQMPREMGAAARRLRPDLVYALILSNPTLTATTGSLFNATAETTAGGHANQTTAALASAGLKAALTSMRNKRLGTGRNAQTLNIRAQYVIVPPDLEWTLLELLNGGEVRQKGDTDAVYTTLNVFRNQGLIPVVEARLDATGVTDPSTGTAYTGSATNWFLAAARRTIKVAYLRGTNRQPQLRSYVMDKGSWGMGWDIKHDIGVAAVDYRGMHKSTGAG